MAVACDENDVVDEDDVCSGALSGEKDRGGGGGGKPPAAKTSSDVAPYLKWGIKYQPADVNVRPGDSLNRTQWVEAHTFWLGLFLSAAKPVKCFSLHCLSMCARNTHRHTDLSRRHRRRRRRRRRR